MENNPEMLAKAKDSAAWAGLTPSVADREALV